MAKDKNTSEEKDFKLVDVATQHVPAIQTPEEDIITVEQAIIILLNEVKQIKKLVG